MKKSFVTVTPDTGSEDKALSFVADVNPVMLEKLQFL